MVTELDQLIREQAKDMRYSTVVFPEDHVSFSLSTPVGESGEHTILDLVASEDRTLRMPLNRMYTGCPVHGRSAVVERANGRYECEVCNRERNTARRRAEGRPEREPCAHSGRKARANGDGTWCPACQREYRDRNRDKVRAYDRERARVRRALRQKAREQCPN